MSRWALLNESTIVGGYVSVVGILLQHIDLQFNFLLLILDTHKHTKRHDGVYASTGRKYDEIQ